MKKVITIICLIVSSVLYSQNVTVSIENIRVNNVNIPNGSPISLGTNNSVNVKFRVDLAKPEHYNIGNSQVWISVFKSNGQRTDYDIIPVPASEFITGASANFDIDIYASDINFGNGNYLSATLKQDNSPGAEWESSHIPVIKSPTFTINPSNVQVACNSQVPITFTMEHNMPGGGVTYNWSHSGWTLISSTSNSRTLRPSSYPPSNVVVTPVFNGDTQPTVTSTATLAPYSPKVSISGPSNICSGSATYTLPLSNGETVEWSVSSSNNSATITNTTGYTTTVNVSGSTQITLTANVTNSCNQTIQLTKQISSGIVIPNGISFTHNNVPIDYSNPPVVLPHSANHFKLTVDSPYSSGFGQNTTFIWQAPSGWSNPYQETTIPQYYSLSGQLGTSGIVSVQLVNDCGDGAYMSVFIDVDTSGGGNPKNALNDAFDSFLIYPNPATDFISVMYNNSNDKLHFNDNKINITLYDFSGNIKKEMKIIDQKSLLDIKDLDNGLYLLKITNNGKESIHRFIKK